jgi:exopolyphosphatase/guanosine-5'-triphosphate,3'-diphosphate pyrophosphatase
VIDLGSNTFHLAITTLDEAGLIHVIDGQKENMRLAELIDDGDIPEKVFKRASDALAAMKSIGQSYQAEFRLVATQAIRAAKNRLAFIEHVQKTTGLKLEIIDGVEEARLSYLGISQSLSFGGETLLALDIGGASTEIAVGQGSDCRYLSSLKMGALHLSKRFLFDRPGDLEAIEELQQSIGSRLLPIQEDLRDTTVQHAAVTSGTAKALARMIHWDKYKTELEDLHGYRFSAAELFAIEKELYQLGQPERIALRWKLESRRADIMLAGCSIVAELTRLLNIQQWIVSTSGLREGVAIDTYARKGLLATNRWHDMRWQSIQAFAKKLRLDTGFAQQVSDCALRVLDAFVALPEFRRLIPELELDRELLQAAAYLLESGKFIGFSGYHRHSYYLISESNLLGYTQEEKHILALINRFARKSAAKSSKGENLPYFDSHIDRIQLLSSALRIARSLLRTRQLRIRGMSLDTTQGGYVLRLQVLPGARLDAERLALTKELKTIEKALGSSFALKIDALGASS